MSNLDRIYDLNLDLVYKVQNDEMEFSVNDVNTSMFYVTFTRNRKEVLNLRGKSVVFYIVKPNGNVVYTNLQYDLEQERFYCDLTTGFKNILGNYVGQIVVYDSETEERVVIPTHISFTVVSDILETSMGDVDEEEQMTILEGLIKDISSWSGKIDEAVNKANESLNMVEGAKQIALTNQNDISNLGSEISQIKEKYTTKEYVDNVIEEIDVTGQLGDYATKDYVDDAIDSIDVTEQLKDYAKSKDIPTKVSQLQNDKGYLTEHQSLEGYATENYVTTEIAKAQLNSGDVDIDLSGYATKDEIPTKISQLINDSNFLTEHQSLDEYAKKIELHSHSNKSALDNISLSSITNWNNHVQSAHAPSNAQKNSDITKSEIEAKLTGDITSHTHSQYLTEHQDISHLASKEYVDDAIESVDVTEQLEDYAKKTEIPTKVSQLTNDKNYLTSIPSEYVTETELDSSLGELEKIETSATEPTDENVSIWIDTSKDSSAYIMPRINDSTTSNSTVWSSEKTYSAILDAQLKGEDIDLSAYALKTEIPTSTSKLINDSGYITEDEVISKGYITEDEVISKGYATEEYVSDAINNAKLEGGDSEIDLSIYAKTSDIPTKVSQLENDKNYLTEHQSLEGYATENYVDEKVADMIDSAPETLDTLNELAQALGDDPNFATTIATGIGKKADKTELEELATTVSETYTTKNELKTIPTSGVNLLALKYIFDYNLSSYSIDNFVYTISKANMYSGIGIYSTLLDKLELNQTYSLQFKVKKLNGTLANIGLHLDKVCSNIHTTVDGVNKNMSVPLNDTWDIDDENWHVCDIRFDTNTLTTAYDYLFVLQPNRNLDTAVTAQIKDIKLEKSNRFTKATDWSPAPEDMASIVQMNSAIKQKADSILDEFNNLSIGGRNLIPDSGNFTDSLGKWVRNSNDNTIEIDSTVKYAGFNTIKINNQNNEGMRYNDFIYNLKPNTVYTYSITAKSSKKLTAVGDEPLHMWLKKNHNDSNSHREIILSISHASIDTQWGRSYVVFKTPNDSESYIWKPLIYFPTIGGDPRPIIHIANFQLEEGNRPTAWSPALEDVQGEIDKVSDNLANNYSTTTQMNSAIEQKANSITQTVSATYTTKNEFNNLNVGSRNYVLNSDFKGCVKNTTIIPKWGSWGNAKVYMGYGLENYNLQGRLYLANQSDVVSGIYQDISSTIIPRNTELTISFNSTVESNVTNIWVGIEYYDSSSNQISGISHTVTTDKTSKRYEHTFTTPNTNYSYMRIIFQHGGSTSTTARYLWFIDYVKLEKGNKATDWSPSPEDMVNEVNNLAFDNENLFRYSRPYLLNNLNVGDVFITNRGTMKRDTLWALSGDEQCYSLTLSSGQSNCYFELKNIYREMYVEKGQSYTLSFDYALSDNSKGILIDIYQGTTYIDHAFRDERTTATAISKKRCDVTWVSTVTGNIYFTFYNQGSIDTTKESILYIYSIKFEKGKHSTIWSPNSNDVRGTVETVSSELKQTATSIEAKFKEVGGYNLIRNSSGMCDDGVPAWSTSANLTVQPVITNMDARKHFQSGRCLVIHTSSPSEEYLFSDRIKLKPNTTYTISGCYATDANSKGIDVFVLTSNTLDVMNAPTNIDTSYDTIATQFSNDSASQWWYTFSRTFTTGSSVKSAYVRIDHNGKLESSTASTSYNWIGDLLLTEGSLVQKWSPSPNDYPLTSQMNSAIQQTAENITNTVSATYTTKDEFNNLSIGGRNLILNSAFLDGVTNWGYVGKDASEVDTTFTFNNHPTLKISATGNTNYQWQGRINYYLPTRDTSFTAGTTLTLSAWYYVEDKTTFDKDFSIEVKGKKPNATNSNAFISTFVSLAQVTEGKWTKVTATTTLDSDYSECFIYPHVIQNGTVWFADLKLEEGDKATSWSPAPEDYSTTSQMNSTIEQKLVDYVTDSELSAKKFATESYVSTQIANLVDSAPDAMNTLNELATAINSNKGIYDSYITTHAQDMAQQRTELQAEIDVKANKSDIPTKVSQLTNDSGYITSIPSEYVTDSELNAKGYLTQHQSLTDYAKKTDLHSHSNKSVIDGISSTKISNWDTAHTHSQSAHAPTNAQKNSDITKAEIEAKLTGDITSHTHLTPRPSKFFVNGYAGMTADGVMEVGKYQDWHNTSEETKDFSIRVMCDSSNSNIVTLPQTSGRLALVEDIPSIIANSKERITYRGNAGSSWIYFPLIQFTPDDSTNYGNVIISGRIGGWENANSATYSMTLMNRSNLRDGNTITATVQAMGEVAKALDVVDIEIYKQSDNSHIAYFKAKYYALWDISYTTFQHSMIYDGSSSATVPSGTMIWSLSSCNKTMLSTSGTLSQTGTPSADTDLVNKAYVDNAIEEASVGGSGSTGDASTHNHDDRYYTESESDSRFYGTSRGALNTNTCYDGKLYMVASGSNVPCGSNYGVILGMPYRQLTGNSKPDFGGQIFLPNGDDNTHPNSMFYRTSLGSTWNEWQEVATKADLENVASHQGLSNTFTIAGTVGWYRIAEGDIDNISGIFEVRGNANSYHSSTILATTSSYNKYPSLACLGHSIYSSSKAGINKARIVYVSGSSSVKCYLEVYLASDVGMTVTVSSANAKGWTLMNGESGDTMPDGGAKTEIGLTQGKMTGNLSGTSDYASKLSSARTITIGNQALTFNGGSDITFDLATMGVASASHGTHLTLGTGSGNAFRGDYGNTAYNHSQSAHAPSNAQKNSDITSSEIQAKLTGNITTHTHSQYLTSHQDLSGYAKTSDLHSHSNKSVLDGITSTNITNYNTAYQHSQTTHAPSNAQKNSDITKGEIETKLIGNITTHTHSQYLTEHQDLTDYAKKEYVDNAIAKLIDVSEEVIFDSATDTLLSDYYTDFTDFMCYVGDVSIEINSTSNPYNVTIDGVTYEGSDSSYDSENNAWYWNVDGTRLYIHNDYDGQNKLVVTWDGFYYNRLVVTELTSSSATHSTVYNVLDYGMSPQNDDNTAQLQSLMDTVNANGGGTIFFPVGTYKFKKAENQPSDTYYNNHVYAILAKSNVSIAGENMENTILKCVDNVPYSLFYRFIGSGSDPLHGCTYSNFTVDCYDTGTYNQVFGKVFYYQYVKNCVFRDLILKGSIATAMGIDYLDNVEINNVTCIDCGRTFKSEESTSGTSGIGIGTGGYDNENFKITDCVCVGCGQYGIFIENQHTLGWGGTTDDSKGCVISNCIVRDGLYRGIGVRGGTNVIVSNCSTYGNTKDGIYLDNKCVNVKIANNNIVNNGANGILVKCNSASEDIVMSDNLIKNNTQYGIALNVSTNGLGLYNNITKKNSKGLYTMSSITHTDSVVRGNAFFDDTNITIDNFGGNTQFNDYANTNTTVTTVSAIECSDFTVPLGVTAPIPYSVIPTYADKSRVSISTTSNIISVDNIAKTITGLSLGTATITLEGDGVTKTVSVTVEEKALEEITVANSQFTKGYKLTESGGTSTSSISGVTDYINISTFLQPKVCVTFNEFNKTVGGRVCVYDINKELLYTTSLYINNSAFNYVGTHLISIEKPTNAYYVRVSYNNLGSGNVQINECNHINSEITLNYDNFTIGKKLMPDGSEGTESTGGVSEFIDVASLLSTHDLDSLAFKSISGASMGGSRIAYYDANKVGLSNSFSLSTSNRTESIPSGTKYVRVFISNIKTDSVISLTFSKK